MEVDARALQCEYKINLLAAGHLQGDFVIRNSNMG